MSRRDKGIKMARPGEPEAVRTTIVGGRPPAGGKGVGNVPRGVEVLIKKAAVDPAFKKMLLEMRAAAAKAIALKLEPAEAAMLDAVPLRQLEAIVANTKVSPKLRPAFLGYAAGAMLAALATKAPADNADNIELRTGGVDAEMPLKAETAATAETLPSKGFGSVKGSVADVNGEPITGALVVVSGTNRYATTNADGNFIITRVPTGIFEVKASRIGFESRAITSVKVKAGYDTYLTFNLTGRPSLDYAGEEEPLITFGIRPDFPVKEGD